MSDDADPRSLAERVRRFSKHLASGGPWTLHEHVELLDAVYKELLEVGKLRSALDEQMENTLAHQRRADMALEWNAKACRDNNRLSAELSAVRARLEQPVPIPVREIVRALERDAANTDTDCRWLAATELRRMAKWEDRTLMCEIDSRPSETVAEIKP